MTVSAMMTRIDDPRDALDKAKRSELYAYAREHNVTEINHDGMPAIIMRRILRQKGLTNIKIPRRILGQPEPQPLLNSKGKPLTIAEQTPAPNPDDPPAVDAEADLARQYQAQKKPPAVQAKSPDKRDRWKTMKLVEMGINEMRWAAQANGLHLTRKTTKSELMKFLRDKGLQ